MKKFNILLESINTVPWARLAHAYHGAYEVPQILTDIILAESEESLIQPVDWLWGAVFHQGSIYSSSIPVVSILIDLLESDPQHIAKQHILEFIEALADMLDFNNTTAEHEKPTSINQPHEPLYAVYIDSDLSKNYADDDYEVETDDTAYFDATAVYPPHVEALCKRAIPIVNSSLMCHDKALQAVSLSTIFALIEAMPESACLFSLDNIFGNPHFDISCWVSIGMLCTDSDMVNSWLKDDNQIIRFIASLNPCTRNDTRSITELLFALNNQDWLDTTCVNGAVHLDYYLYFAVLAELLQRVPNQSENSSAHILPSLTKLLERKAKEERLSAENILQPILQWAFPQRVVPEEPWTQERYLQLLENIKNGMPEKQPKIPEPLPNSLTYTQKQILATLCAQPHIWKKIDGNTRRVYDSVQLPYDREILTTLVGTS